MAYAYTVVKTKVSEIDYVYEITETGIIGGASGDQYQIDVPKSGLILRYKSARISGTGTLDPIVTVTTGVTSGIDVTMENGTASADIDLQPASPIFYYASALKLYCNNHATSGASVKTKIFIRDTWGI